LVQASTVSDQYGLDLIVVLSVPYDEIFAVITQNIEVKTNINKQTNKHKPKQINKHK